MFKKFLLRACFCFVIGRRAPAYNCGPIQGSEVLRFRVDNSPHGPSLTSETSSKAIAPARPCQIEAKGLLGLGVRCAPRIGHDHHCIANENTCDPRRDFTWRFGVSVSAMVCSIELILKEKNSVSTYRHTLWPARRTATCRTARGGALYFRGRAQGT
jgi:hypothetical protein